MKHMLMLFGAAAGIAGISVLAVKLWKGRCSGK